MLQWIKKLLVNSHFCRLQCVSRVLTFMDVLLSSMSVSASSKCPSSATFWRTIEKLPTSLHKSTRFNRNQSDQYVLIGPALLSCWTNGLDFSSFTARYWQNVLFFLLPDTSALTSPSYWAYWVAEYCTVCARAQNTAGSYWWICALTDSGR